MSFSKMLVDHLDKEEQTLIFFFLLAPHGTLHGATIIISNCKSDVKLTSDNPTKFRVRKHLLPTLKNHRYPKSKYKLISFPETLKQINRFNTKENY
jgi:hypothetical protein